MKSVWKTLGIVFGILTGLYIVLFLVFWFDLDGKALFYGIEPFLKNHYDKIKRKDPLERQSETARQYLAKREEQRILDANLFLAERSTQGRSFQT